jgi:PII-like signaling protein
MLQVGPALKVSVHLNQDTGAPHGFLYQEILRFLDEKGVAGATAIRAHEGFGSHRRLHSKEAGDVASERLPVLIYFIERSVSFTGALRAAHESAEGVHRSGYRTREKSGGVQHRHECRTTGRFDLRPGVLSTPASLRTLNGAVRQRPD